MANKDFTVVRGTSFMALPVKAKAASAGKRGVAELFPFDSLAAPVVSMIAGVIQAVHSKTGAPMFKKGDDGKPTDEPVMVPHVDDEGKPIMVEEKDADGKPVMIFDWFGVKGRTKKSMNSTVHSARHRYDDPTGAKDEKGKVKTLRDFEAFDCDPATSDGYTVRVFRTR